mgnify:CR=1 FL=1
MEIKPVIISNTACGAFVAEPKVFGDSRGYFVETYREEAFAPIGINTAFVQDNESFTAACGTLRGIHFQKDPWAQAKLVRVAHGAVMDIAVDLRRGSPTYMKWAAVELSAENKRMLYIPRGFGHAFLTLTDDVLFIYKADNYYNRECDRSIRYNDPDINVAWTGLLPCGMTEPILSDKDRNAPFLRDSDCDFVF